MRLTRRHAFRFAAVLAGTLLGLLVGEVACRLASPEAGEEMFYGGLAPMPPGLYEWTPALGKEPVPGAKVTIKTLAFDNEIRINSLRMRGPEPGPGPKWLTVGDSFTMGVQVPEEATFQALLSARVGAEVLNGGCDDFSTFQAARRYAKIAGAVDVDRVINLFFLGNDIVDNTEMDRRMRPNRPGPQHLPTVNVWGWIQGKSMLAAWANVAIARAMTSRQSHAGEGLATMLTMWSDRGKWSLDRALPKTYEALEELKETAAAHNDPLMVVVVPPGWAVDPPALQTLLQQFNIAGTPTDAPRQAVVAALAQRQIPTCDLWDAFTQAAKDHDTAFLRFDGHWNREGHRIAAEAIAACLDAQPR